MYRGRMSLRALYVRIHYLPADDVFWRAVEADEERAKQQALQQRLRERRDYYKQQGRSA